MHPMKIVPSAVEHSFPEVGGGGGCFRNLRHYSSRDAVGAVPGSNPGKRVEYSLCKGLVGG